MITKKAEGCTYAAFWGWQGDGGLCAIYDGSESIALKTAIRSSLKLVGPSLSGLRMHLEDLGLKGSLHLRVAIHKGHLTYKGDDKHGSIHSKDLNFVAHLEKVSPVDSITILEDVYQCCPPDIADQFAQLPFPFEGKNVYCNAPAKTPAHVFEWISNVSVQNSIRLNVFGERPSEESKALLIQQAQQEVIDFGAALNTCSQYLVSTRRPDYYRKAVVSLLDRGVNYTCLVLDPDSRMAELYGELRNEDLRTKIRVALDRLKEFAEKTKGKRGAFKVFGYSVMPYLASIAIDRKADGLLLLSSYLPNSPDLIIGRADTPHFLLPKAEDPGLYALMDSCVDYYFKGATQFI